MKKPLVNSYRLKTGRLDFSNPVIMGIMNVTPDSFSDGGMFTASGKPVRGTKPSLRRAVSYGLEMASEGAGIIDIGGESTRPGAKLVSAREELRRVVPVISALADKTSVPISVDTSKPEVARAALSAGASIINDVTGLADPDMIDLAAEYDCPVIVMHMKGRPGTMQRAPRYKNGNVVAEILAFFERRTALLMRRGVTKIVIDPGIGFGKTHRHNLDILRGLGAFVSLGYPVAVGISRKSTLGWITGEANPGKRFAATVASTALAVMKGASVIRVHDVRENIHAAQFAALIR